MIEQLSQQTVNEYASDALTIQEPQGADYSQGVQVGKTIPAKWWNWLFNAVTKRVQQSRTDAQNMLTEMQNVVTDAGITLDSADDTQLSQAIAAKADTQVVEYVRDKRRFASLWQKVSPKGLLPVPDPVAGTSYNWYFNPQKAGEMYWSAHQITRVVSGGSFAENAYVAFSKDLENWHLFDVSTIDVLFEYAPNFSACVTFFKGTYYMCVSSLHYLNTQTEPSMYAILSSSDTKHWEVEVKFFRTESANTEDTSGCIFSVNNRIMCVIGKRVYTSDGTNWTYTAVPSNIGAIKDSVSVEPKPIGNKFMVGEVIVDGTTLVPTNPNGTSMLNRKTYKLQQGNIVSDSGYTVDSSYQVTDFTSAGDFVSGTLRDNKYILVSRSTNNYSFSEDGINFTDMTSPETGTPICELDDKFYYAERSGFDHFIYESEDLLSWTNTGNKSYSNIMNILQVAKAFVSSTKYSYDKGATWAQSVDSDGNNFCAYSIFTELNSKYYTCSQRNVDNVTWYELLYIENRINRVIGHTLYLR